MPFQSPTTAKNHFISMEQSIFHPLFFGLRSPTFSGSTLCWSSLTSGFHKYQVVDQGYYASHFAKFIATYAKACFPIKV
jgi:hypothetical protein